MTQPHILLAVGARPNFMKAAPIFRALQASRRARVSVVHTGQHYDRELSAAFFRDLGLPPPAANLKVGSASRARQITMILERFERFLSKVRPDAVLVMGDVNSTLACALGASKAFYPNGTRACAARHRPILGHVEAGLRSFDGTMPEEANRIATDRLSNLLFAPSRDAVAHLRAEGIPAKRIFFVGNVMIDSLRHARIRARGSAILKRLKVSPRRYAVVTLHRPSNVDDPQVARGIFQAVEQLGKDLPVVFPMHPRTRDAWRRHGFLKRLHGKKGFILVSPLGYLDFVKLMSCARLIVTDSGGIQEESSILKVPCLTVRDNTERPITLTHGTNRLVGTDPRRIMNGYRAILNGRAAKGRAVPRWDGRVAQRIVRVLLACL